MSAKAIVLSLEVDGQRHGMLWDTSAPLPLGHPFRWIAETTPHGVRIRHLSTPADRVRRDGVIECAHEQIARGCRLDLQPGVSLDLRDANAFANPFATPANLTTPISAAPDLALFELGVTGQLIGSQMLEEREIVVRAGVRGPAAFRLSRQDQDWQFKPLREGVSVFVNDQPRAADGARFSRTDMLATRIELEFAERRYRWGFRAVDSSLLAQIGTHLPAPQPDAGEIWFRKAIAASACALTAFLAASLLWPKGKPGSEELVPAQYASFVMPKTEETKANSGSASPAADSATQTAKQAEKTAVVQAFRDKALKSAVNGLLKGGMTNLLKQSDFLSGKQIAANAKRVFDAETSVVPTGELTGLSQQKQVHVAALGGSAGAQGDGRGVGYTKGKGAAVAGQGKSFISAKAMADTMGSLVEDGLTKEEVGEVIHSHMAEVRYCYESTLIKTPDLEGKLIVNFTIGGGGTVKESGVRSSTLPDARLDDCILRRLVTWKFPKTKGGIDVAVTYPFIFKMLGR